MKKLKIENSIIFSSFLTFSLTTTESGISYSFIGLILLLLVPKIFVILNRNTSNTFVLLFVLMYRYLFCDDSVLTLLNLMFCALSFFYIVERQSLSDQGIPKLYIQVTFFMTLIQFFTNNYFDLRLNEIWSDSDKSVVLYRPNGLSVEASYGATLICVAGIALGEKLSRAMFIMITVTVLMMNSGFGFISWLTLILSHYRFNSRLLLIPALLLLVLLMPYLDIFALQRLSSFGAALQGNFDLSNLMSVDHSASVRLIPLLVVFSKSLELWYHLILPMPMNEYIEVILTTLKGVDFGWKGGGFLPGGVLTMGAFGLVVLRMLSSKVILNVYYLAIFIIAAINIPFSSQSFFVLTVLLRIGFINKKKLDYDRLQLS